MSSRGSSGGGRSSRSEQELARLAQGTGRDLRNLQVKLTYVGEQTKAIPTIAFTSFHHLIQMDWFRPLRTQGLSYENDEHDVWNFTVLPDEMLRVVTALAGLGAVRQSCPVDQAYLSLAVVLRDSRLGQSAVEVLLDLPGAEVTNSAIHDALDEQDGVGRRVLELQRQII